MPDGGAIHPARALPLHQDRRAHHAATKRSSAPTPTCAGSGALTSLSRHDDEDDDGNEDEDDWLTPEDRFAAAARTGGGSELPPVGEEWDDWLADVAAAVFRHGSSLGWARYVWAEVLATSGLTQLTTELDRARAVLRRRALDVLRDEFFTRLDEEGGEGSWWIEVDDVVGAEPLVVGDQLIPPRFAQMIRRFPGGRRLPPLRAPGDDDQRRRPRRFRPGDLHSADPRPGDLVSGDPDRRRKAAERALIPGHTGWHPPRSMARWPEAAAATPACSRLVDRSIQRTSSRPVVDRERRPIGRSYVITQGTFLIGSLGNYLIADTRRPVLSGRPRRDRGRQTRTSTSGSLLENRSPISYAVHELVRAECSTAATASVAPS